MRIIRNTGHVKKHRNRSRLFVGLGLILLLSSSLPFFLSGSEWIIPAYLALGVGFLLFISGTQQHTKWSRKPRADVALDETLSRLNDRYAIIHYPELGPQSPEHVLVTPGGVLVMTTRDVSGELILNKRRWRKKGSPLLRFFNMGAPQLGDPTRENAWQVERIEKVFEEEALSGDIQGVIVFLPDRLELEMREPEVEVIHISELLEYVRDFASDATLSTDERNEIVEALSRGEELERIGATSSRPKKKVKAA